MCLCIFVQAAKYIIVVGTMQLSLLYVVGYDREVSERLWLLISVLLLFTVSHSYTALYRRAVH